MWNLRISCGSLLGFEGFGVFLGLGVSLGLLNLSSSRLKPGMIGLKALRGLGIIRRRF